MLGLVRLANIGAMACTGFVTPAAILASVPSVPIQPLAILVGIDKFMSECRPLTNVVRNGVVTIVVSRW